jgi:hypothetical protein
LLNKGLEKVSMSKSSLLLLFVLTAILLASCGSETPSPIATETVNQVIQNTPTLVEELTPVDEPTQLFEGYPAEGYATSTPFDYTQSDEGYPVPETTPFFADLPDKLNIPTPESGNGIIVGQLLTPGPGGEPFYNPLYLATTIPASIEGYPPVIALSESDAPSSTQDKEGRFLFVNIPPGTYALALWSPVASTIIQDPETGDYMLVEVREGEVLDLGVIGIP